MYGKMTVFNKIFECSYIFCVLKNYKDMVLKYIVAHTRVFLPGILYSSAHSRPSRTTATSAVEVFFASLYCTDKQAAHMSLILCFAAFTFMAARVALCCADICFYTEDNRR